MDYGSSGSSCLVLHGVLGDGESGTSAAEGDLPFLLGKGLVQVECHRSDDFLLYARP